MIAALLIAGGLHHGCRLEYRDTRSVRAGAVASFQVSDTCELDGLTIVADDDSAGVTLTGTNPRHGHTLTVRIRVPRHVKRGTVLYPYAYTGSDPYSAPIADLPPITVT